MLATVDLHPCAVIRVLCKAFALGAILRAFSCGDSCIGAAAPPHPCLLDFADNLIESAEAKGYGDALGQDGRAGFRKESGEPVFVQVSAVPPGQ